MSEKICLCHYPCETENCPKEKNSMCHVNYCEVVEAYSQLIYKKNYCSVCGRKLK
jgi:calcineurin-like phosphoesterase family protein